MYFTDRGIEELEARRGEETVTLEWVAARLREFVDLNPEFETPTERLATWLARLDDDDPDDPATRPTDPKTRDAIHLDFWQTRYIVSLRHDTSRLPEDTVMAQWRIDQPQSLDLTGVRRLDVRMVAGSVDVVGRPRPPPRAAPTTARRTWRSAGSTAR